MGREHGLQARLAVHGPQAAGARVGKAGDEQEVQGPPFGRGALHAGYARDADGGEGKPRGVRSGFRGQTRRVLVQHRAQPKDRDRAAEHHAREAGRPGLSHQRGGQGFQPTAAAAAAPGPARGSRPRGSPGAATVQPGLRRGWPGRDEQRRGRIRSAAGRVRREPEPASTATPSRRRRVQQRGSRGLQQRWRWGWGQPVPKPEPVPKSAAEAQWVRRRRRRRVWRGGWGRLPPSRLWRQRRGLRWQQAPAQLRAARPDLPQRGPRPDRADQEPEPLPEPVDDPGQGDEQGRPQEVAELQGRGHCVQL